MLLDAEKLSQVYPQVRILTILMKKVNSAIRECGIHDGSSRQNRFSVSKPAKSAVVPIFSIGILFLIRI